jgi:hypothetical protein
MLVGFEPASLEPRWTQPSAGRARTTRPTTVTAVKATAWRVTSRPQRVGSHRCRAAYESSGCLTNDTLPLSTERLHALVERPAEPRDLVLRDPGQAERLDQPVDLAGGDAVDVGLLHAGDQRLLGHAGDKLDPAARERDEEEDVDPFQPGGLDGEEITGERRRRLLAKKVAPGELVAPRRGREPVAEKDRPHRCRRNRDAQALQFADDPSVAPARVFACES